MIVKLRDWSLMKLFRVGLVILRLFWCEGEIWDFLGGGGDESSSKD